MTKQEWFPFKKQEEALLSPAYETLFGGSRGPGKTDTGIVWLTYDIEHPRYRALVIRRNADDLSDWVDRVRRFYSPFGASIAYRPAIITFPSGAVIRTGHLKDDQAYTKYQGHEYHRMLIEELTQIPDEKRYLQLIASCRSTVKELQPRVFATTNPGGVGHYWVKQRFVDQAPFGKVFKDKISGRTRVFIPATLDDNPILQELDPGYIKQLDALKEVDEELWKAWRHGSWEVFAGQFFKNFRRDLHVITSHFPDKQGFVVGSLDWGRVANFAFFLTHVFPVHYQGQMFYRAVTFLEVYGNEKDPDDWAKIIRLRMDGHNLKLPDLSSIQSDTQIFGRTPSEQGKTIAHWFYEVDPEYQGKLQPASKDRVSGWEAMQNWLSLAPDGQPYWLITEDCLNLIKQIPVAIHDENKVNDIDDSMEDDALDSIRYGLISLKWINAKIGTVGRGGEDDYQGTFAEELDEWGEE